MYYIYIYMRGYRIDRYTTYLYNINKKIVAGQDTKLEALSLQIPFLFFYQRYIKVSFVTIFYFYS